MEFRVAARCSSPSARIGPRIGMLHGPNTSDALAYDGVAPPGGFDALPSTWPHPLLSGATNIFLGRAAADYWRHQRRGKLRGTWSLPDTGKLRN